MGQYKKRLNELENQNTGTSHSGAQEILNLNEKAPEKEKHEHKVHLNSTERKALDKKEAAELKVTSKGAVKEAEDLGDSLKRAGGDKHAITETAARPVANVVTAFS